MKKVRWQILLLIASSVVVIYSLLVVGADRNVANAASPTPAATPPPDSPKKLALLVGINNYKYPTSVSPLAGSLNDVEEMRQVLIGKFGFPPENILVLKDSQATHAGIIQAIQNHLIAKAQPGDIVVFDYSGHGSYVPDPTGKRISGLDSTIVPYDSRDPKGEVLDITGAELHRLLVQLAAKTKNLTFILDSCHSGSLVRGARVRAIPPDSRSSVSYAATVTRGVAESSPEAVPPFATIAAATSKESAFEHFAGVDHGALTYFLVQELRSAKAGATYRDVMDNVIGNVTANYPSQHPSLEGAEADQYLFGDRSSLAKTYVTADPSLLDARRVTLGQGQIEGATVGSTFDVYPPGSKKFAPPEKPVARVQIASVDALTSEANVLSGAKISTASRAIEREHRYGKSRLRVFLDGVDTSPTLQSVRAALQSTKYVELVDKIWNCNMQVRQAGDKIETLAADSSTLSPPIPITDPDVVERLTKQVQLWAKWFGVLSIRNPQSDIDLQFTLKASQTRDPMARVGKADIGVKDGELVDATIRNDSARDLYIAILDLSSDGSIGVVYPSEQGVKEVLKPGLSFTRQLKASLPKGRSTATETDILKVFGSYKPIDLTPLTQSEIRSVDRGESLGPLEELLADSSGTTRQVELSKPLDLGNWTTAQRVLVVRRAH